MIATSGEATPVRLATGTTSPSAAKSVTSRQDEQSRPALAEASEQLADPGEAGPDTAMARTGDPGLIIAMGPC
jgi:hypothetical protein